MACTETNYKDVVVRANPSSFVIYPLENSTDYTWNLKNKFGQNYMGDGTSDSQGRLTIPVTLPLRPDFFHPFSGDWVLTMYRGSTSIIFCGLYTNITIHFESIVSDNTDAVIDLDCSPGIPGNGGNGLSAYEVAVANGFEGSETQWLASLIGPQGPQGPQGIQGTTGASGSTGATGAAGSVWSNGAGAPSNGNGANGDYYLNGANGDVYKKASGTWGIVANIKGADGTGGGSISDDSVTNAKLANVATATIKGRVTASTGDPEDLTVAQVKTLLAYAPSDISGFNAAVDACIPNNDFDDAYIAGNGSTTPYTVLKSDTAPSGVNTGDETLSTIKTKLGISTLSGSNTGDETAATIKSKLSITTLSGANTGDQDLSGLVVKANNLSDLASAATARTNLGLGTLATQSGTFSGTSSGTNTGDETVSTIKTKLGITTLTGSNTGDQDLSSYATKTGTETLTNKRVNPRVQSVTSSATVTPNADNDDAVKITAQAVGLTIANPSGTPVAMQSVVIRIKDNGTAQTVAFGTIYRALGITKPTTTVLSKTMYLGLIYNADDTKWDIVGLSNEA